MLQEIGVTVVALMLGFVVGRLLSDQIKKAGVPIATGNIGKVPIGQGAAGTGATGAYIRPAS